MNKPIFVKVKVVASDNLYYVRVDSIVCFQSNGYLEYNNGTEHCVLTVDIESIDAILNLIEVVE